MGWETVQRVRELNGQHLKVWVETRRELCPECETRAVRTPQGKRGCTMCGWSEDYGVVLNA